MKGWATAVLVGLIVAATWGYRMSATHDLHARALPTGTGVALDSLHPIGTSRSDAYSSVAVIAHRTLTTYDGKPIDHGIMFSLVPGHSASSGAYITFPLAKRYDRLSALVLASAGSGAAPLTIEVQDVSSRSAPPKLLFSGQAAPGGHLSFMAGVRGVSALQVSASTSFDCVCDSAATVLVVGLLTRTQARSAH